MAIFVTVLDHNRRDDFKDRFRNTINSVNKGHDETLVHWQDVESPKVGQSDRVHFKPYLIKNRDQRKDESGKVWRSLKSLMAENGHDWIDILKIDIEGFEYDAMEAILSDFGDVLPFSQLQMELCVYTGTPLEKYGQQDGGGDDNEKGGDSISFDKFLKWWESIEAKGVYPFWPRSISSQRCHQTISGVQKVVLIFYE
ncbi:hypothetical protein BGW38_005038 [Lunasporangiospora selenospora]|uniref:Methyltransferase FkbM domain-containing protein n=1 Tax=Lunasporangiospora selenospora TaxID=979761 RepID=A0A9P6KBS3_9FUNG|nr:hypothetical protein BGW38_005038 [Lunasporangiospora selenospora]